MDAALITLQFFFNRQRTVLIGLHAADRAGAVKACREHGRPRRFDCKPRGQYVLGLNAVNCQTDDSLAQEQAAAGGKELVLKALGEAAAKLRQNWVNRAAH
jgi:hypothetical protein